jgi:hypothetical protein
MGVWSPAFQHQFLDGNLLNFNAAPIAPGTSPDISFEGPLVRPTPPPEERGFPVRRGNRFTYEFEPDTFARVIGVDIKLDITFPQGTANAQLGGNVVLANDNTVRLLLGFFSGNARLQLVVDNQFQAAIDQFDPSAPLRIQTRWHTHGQAHIWVNGRLRSYLPGLAPGRSFAIDRIAFGHHDTSGFAPGAPAFLIRRLGVKLLRDNDASRFIDDLVAVGEPPDISDECRKKLEAIDAEAIEAMRLFMTQTVALLSRPWDASQGGSPFTAEGIAAHEAAVAAGKAFVAFLGGRAGGDAVLVKERGLEFLALVEAADPAGYAQALAGLQQIIGRYDPPCLASIEPAGQLYAAAFQPLAELLRSIGANIQSPGAPNG